MRELIIFFLVLVTSNYASKILVVYPTPSKSHLIVMKALTTELARQGHQITVVSQFPLEKPMKNYRDVKIQVEEDTFEPLIGEFIEKRGDLWGSVPLIPKLVTCNTDSAEATLNNPEFQRIMSEESFDLIIFGYFLNNFFLGIADHFKCPVIALSTSVSFDAMKLIGNPVVLSAVPEMSLNHKGYMNFRLRLRNFIGYSFMILFDHFNHRWQRKLYEKHFPSDHHLSYDEIHQNISLVLLNSYFSQDQVRPLVPGMIEVGGLQIKKPSPLPENLLKWMNEAEHGVVFFSLGSIAKSSLFPREIIDIFMTSLGKLKERVIFKWEADELPGKPDNVLVAKWLPQNDILAHPNVKLFISHCGLGSTVESLHYAVPIIGMPIYGDQMSNALNVQTEGWGIVVSMDSLSSESFSNAIQEVLTNPKYKNKVQELSNIFKDRPQTPLETAVYWTEYVIRHRGAKHMQYPGVFLNFYQKYSLDVIAFLLLVLYVVFKIIKILFLLIIKVLKRIIKLLKGNDEVNQKKKN